MKKEEWIEYMSGAVSEIGRAEPNPYLFTRITELLNQKKVTGQSAVKKPFLLRWALAGCVALILNIFVISFMANHKKQEIQKFNLEALSAEMGLNETYNY